MRFPAEQRRPLSETRGSAGGTLLIYVMPQRQWISTALVRKSEAINRHTTVVINRLYSHHKVTDKTGMDRADSFTGVSKENLTSSWWLSWKDKKEYRESFNSWMKAYITEKLVNGCWGWLILFQIDTIVGIFSTQGGDVPGKNRLKTSRETTRNEIKC